MIAIAESNLALLWFLNKLTKTKFDIENAAARKKRWKRAERRAQTGPDEVPWTLETGM